MLLPGLPRLDSGGRGGTIGSFGTVIFCSLADRLVSMDVGGGWWFLLALSKATCSLSKGLPEFRSRA